MATGCRGKFWSAEARAWEDGVNPQGWGGAVQAASEVQDLTGSIVGPEVGGDPPQGLLTPTYSLRDPRFWGRFLRASHTFSLPADPAHL